MLSLKKLTSRSKTVKKLTKKEKIQINIKTFLHNVSLKDQDLKVINKQRMEEYEDTIKYSTDESNIATRNITSGIIETQTNWQNSGRLYKLYYQLKL